MIFFHIIINFRFISLLLMVCLYCSFVLLATNRTHTHTQIESMRLYYRSETAARTFVYFMCVHVCHYWNGWMLYKAKKTKPNNEQNMTSYTKCEYNIYIVLLLCLGMDTLRQCSHSSNYNERNEYYYSFGTKAAIFIWIVLTRVNEYLNISEKDFARAKFQHQTHIRW